MMPRGNMYQAKRPSRKKHSTLAPPSLESLRKRLKWKNKSMISAMEAVKKGTSINRASEEHGVPRATLQDQVLGNVQHGRRPGQKP